MNPLHRYRPLSGLIAAICVAVVVLAVGCSSKSHPTEARRDGLRLVSASPGITSTLVALGVDDQLVAVSDYCRRSPKLEDVARIGSALTFNLEVLASLRSQGPLRVIGPEMKMEWWAPLQTLATVEVLPWSTREDLIGSTRRLGTLVEREAAGVALAQEIEAALQATAPREGARVALLLEAGEAFDGTFWFVKSNSIHGAALHGAGYRNAFPDATHGPPQIGAEQLIAADPDFIVLVANRPFDEPARRQALARLEALTPLAAPREGGVGFLGYEGALEEGPGVVQLTRRLKSTVARLDQRARGGARD